MTAAWPTGVNLLAMTGTYSEKPVRNAATFAPGIGPSIDRRRMSISSEIVSFSTRMTFTEYATFINWYRNTISDGTLPFYRTRPRTGTIEQFKFAGDAAPECRSMGNNLLEVQMVMRTVPGTGASWLPLLSNADITKVPTAFADFTTEGSSDPHYWYSGDKYGSFAKWLAAIVGGTFARTGAKNYLQSSLMVSAATGVPRFTKDASGNVVGLRVTPTQTELCLWNRDLLNAVWTKTSCTAAKTQTGIDGVANSASLLTATGANASANQALTASSALSIAGYWLRRVTGIGTIQISIDNGTTKTTVATTAAWTFFPISAAQTLANPRPWIGITTSGDAIAVDVVSVRQDISVYDPIATTTATVTVNGDDVFFTYSLLTFSAFVKTVNMLNQPSTFFPRFVGTDGASSQAPIYQVQAYAGIGTFNGSAVLTETPSPFASNKSMVAGSLSGRLFTANGASVLRDSNPLVTGSISKIYIGSGGGGNSYAGGEIAQFGMWDSVVAASADLVRITT